MRYALLSVFDKTGIVDFAKLLTSFNYKIISTGGTAKVLTENNISVIPISEITKNPESFEGRMKTISFEVESGILFDRSNPKHVKEAEKLNIKPIDIVVCNLYPFEKEQIIENIDVGGPTMIRAAAKNYKDVIVVVDPNDYRDISSILPSIRISLQKRKALAAKAFYHLSFYDSQIAGFFSQDLFPETLSIGLRKKLDLRYGENPHQKGVVYLFPNSNSPFERLKKKWGRELSLTNVTDVNAGLESVRLFKESCAVAIKHNNPSGIALGKTTKEALERAIEADPMSAFGAVLVLNKKMDKKTASIIGEFKKGKYKSNIDIVAVPAIDKDALDYLRSIRESMGIYTFGKIKDYSGKNKTKNKNGLNIKWIDGGLALQTPDTNIEKGFRKWKTVTKKKPTAKELRQMKIAWKFISRIRSNAVIVVDKEKPMTRGIGSGQTSRVRSTRIALLQAGRCGKDAILASDSFFPFTDSIKLAASKGIAAIVQQGGSINDKAVIEAANKAGVAMVFTGRRAFWH